jgi:DNA-binding LytR/AlgR family response regulator
MKVIIVEDEKLSAEHLSNMLARIDASIEVVKTFDTVKRTVEYLKTAPSIDLLFLDIHIADGLSFEIFDKLNVETPIIFTTAYSEYAVKAFKLNSIDYLLKPIDVDELLAAINKFSKLNKRGVSDSENILNTLTTIYKQNKSRFMVKMGDTISSIKSEEIAHFVAEDGIVLLVNTIGKRFSVDYTLDQLEPLLDPNSFFRINRKVILNINLIQKVNSYFNSRYKITSPFLNEEESIVSRERVNDFKIWLDK